MHGYRVEGLTMYNFNDINVTSWESAANHIMANNSKLAVAVRQVCLTAIEEGKVRTNVPSSKPKPVLYGSLMKLGCQMNLHAPVIFCMFSVYPSVYPSE